MDYNALIPSIMTALFVGGVSWGATKSALNGTRQRVQEIHKTVQAHIKDETESDRKLHERITRVETKVDILIDRYK